MATHIGIGSQLHPDGLTEDSLQGIDHIYMESYLWDHDLTKQTLKKVGKIAKTMNIETSLSLSDPFCVDRHRDALKEFIEEYVYLVFCNFDEAKMFALSDRPDRPCPPVSPPGQDRIAGLSSHPSWRHYHQPG